MRRCEYRELGRVRYRQACELQRRLVERRKAQEIPDQLLFLEHPHVITLGRNAQPENIVAEEDVLRRAGVEVCETDRGGDVTYHGPGQLIGYPILDLGAWKRDVAAYVGALEETIIGALAEFGVAAHREPGMRGVWTKNGKIAAIGVHISRWVTSHGFALNVTTDLDYFRFIVPCGLTKPVTSMEREGAQTGCSDVAAALVRHFGRVFECEMVLGERTEEMAS